MDPDPTSPLQQFGLAVVFFFGALAFIVLLLRIYSKVRSKNLGLDDVLAGISMNLSIALTVASYFYIKTNYVGIPTALIPPPDSPLRKYSLETGMKWTFTSQLLYNPTLALIKSSVLIFLLQLGGQKPGVRLAIHCLNTFNLAMLVTVFCVILFQCTPISYFWTCVSVPAPGEKGKCINQPVFYLIQAAVNILTDALTLALPFWIFLGLKMPRKLKVATLWVFVLGIIVPIVGLARFIFLYLLFYSSHGTGTPNYTMSFVLSAVETNLAIVCACAPTLWGLARAWFPRTFVGTPSMMPTGATATRTTIGGNRESMQQRYSQRWSNRQYQRGSRRYSWHNNGTGAGSGVEEMKLTPQRKDGSSRGMTMSEVEGLGPLSPSEEEILSYNGMGIVRRVDVVVKRDHQDGVDSAVIKKDDNGEVGGR
ncbi:hypothetical protein QBC35DRAFT_121861 [Podospora australis]|uniref:Rhodopsin domain-containing protein n=1 Tax=Podospora australis TaxID=1536484 RepID=A0AAN6WYW7_9PEZI|nr:hypothetical protein QBC35DRAFT_121861 [Podospora australis]